jgi:hypothetical protein
MNHEEQQPNDLPIVHNEPSLVYGQFNCFDLSTRDVSKNYVKQILGISKLSTHGYHSDFHRYLQAQNEFNPPVTEKILEIEEVYRTGLSAFGDSFHN